MAVLWHEMPEDAAVASHADWMLAREPEAESPLLTFRLARSLHDLATGEQLHAEHIGDHRTAYLRHEGPVSGNRGVVSRLAEGRVTAVRHDQSGAVHLKLSWHSGDDTAQEMMVAIQPEENSGNYQVKVLAIVSASRYK